MEAHAMGNHMPLGLLKRYLFSLRTVVVFAVLAGVVLSSVLAYLDFASRARQEHIANLEVELGRLATLTALAMREPIWQFSPEQAESILDSVFINPDILSVEVKDHEDQVFARRIRDALPNDSSPDQSISATQAIRRDGALVGHISVVMSTAGYLAKLEAARAQYIRTTSIVLAGSLVIILMALQWGLVRPVRRLVASSTLIAQGQLDAPIPLVYSTELDTLAGALESTRLALLALFADVKARNQSLADANEHLEQRVADRTHSLETALVSLQRAQDEIIQTEKLASLGRVVAGVAHELNTPIGNALVVATTIAAHLETLQKEITGGTLRRSTLALVTEQSLEGIAIFVSNVQRAAQLISNFKQVAIDQTSDQRRVFDLAQVSADVLSMVGPAIRKANCELVTEMEADVRCDSFPGAYGQVLSNLVMNAALHGYPDDAGGRIWIRTQRVSLDEVSLTVRDEGKGMNDEVRQRIFDPFFTTRLGAGGSGLGMNIVHGIVTRALDGAVTVKSAPGQGAEVTVRFASVAL
jgi:signal transduction histidine kinase